MLWSELSNIAPGLPEANLDFKGVSTLWSVPPCPPLIQEKECGEEIFPKVPTSFLDIGKFEFKSEN